jgi:hypothetical protein
MDEWIYEYMDEWILHRLWWSRFGESATAWEQQTQQRGKCLRMLRMSSWSSSSQRNVQYRGPRGRVLGGEGGGCVCFFSEIDALKLKFPRSTHDFCSLKKSRHTWERFWEPWEKAHGSCNRRERRRGLPQCFFFFFKICEVGGMVSWRSCTRKTYFISQISSEPEVVGYIQYGWLVGTLFSKYGDFRIFFPHNVATWSPLFPPKKIKFPMHLSHPPSVFSSREVAKIRVTKKQKKKKKTTGEGK